MLSVITLSKGKLLKGSVDDAKDSSKVSIIDGINLSKTDYETISKVTGLSVSDLKEYSDEKLRPRVEDFEENSVIVFKHPIRSKSTFETHPITIILSKNKNYVILLRHEKCESIAEMMSSESLSKTLQQGVGYTVYRILDKITLEYFRILDYVEEESDKIEKNVVKRPSDTSVSKIFSLKKGLIFFHKALAANREVIVNIEKEYVSHFDKKTTRRFRDVYNDIIQLIDMEETYRDILTGTLDVYLSAISNNLNRTMKTLTIIASLVMVPTLISGIYGMNFNTQISWLNMPEINWIYGYPFALFLMLISMALLLAYFRWKKWL